MSKSLRRVRAALEAAGVVPDILEMPESTRTAAKAAAAVNCELDQIAKSIIFRGEKTGHVVLFLTAGGNQVDPEKASVAAGQPLGRANAEFVRAETGFAIGGVAPVGHLQTPDAYIDHRLLEFKDVWAAAGTPRHVFRISSAKLQEVSRAQLYDFTS